MPGRERLARVRIYARRYPRPYWVLLTGESVQSLGFGLVVPFFALYLTQTLGIPPGQVGLLMVVWAVTGITGQPLGGLLADRIGRRPVMLAGLSLAGLSAGAFGLVEGLPAAAALTLCWGIANSVFEPAAAAYVTDVAPPELRTEAFGLWRVANNAFFAVGPPLGALLIWLGSLRVTFLFAAAAILVYCAIVWRALPESRPARDEHDPVPRFREALGDRTLVVLAVGVAVATTTYAWYEDALPVFLHEERGIAIAAWGLVFGINPVLVATLQYPIARWAAKRSSRMVLGLGAVVQGLALALLLPLTSVGGLALAVIVLSFGEMLLAPVSSAVAADLAPARLRGSYQGVINLAWEGAWGPSALVGLWLIGRGQGELLLTVALPLGFAAALLFLALPGGRLQREPALATADPLHP